MTKFQELVRAQGLWSEDFVQDSDT